MQWIYNHQLLILLLALATVFAVVWLVIIRQQLKINRLTAIILGILHTIYGLSCVMIFARMEGASFGSVSIFGATFFMPLGYWIVSKAVKQPAEKVFDIFTVPLLFTLFLTRINCLANGCCFGKMIGYTGHLWPTRETEMVFYTVLLIVFIPRIWKGKTRGEVYPIYMVSYGLLRFILEFLRVSTQTTSLWHLSHLWAVFSLLIGAGVLYWQKHCKKD